MAQPGIKSMQLYSDVDRIYNDLKSIGVKDDDKLSVKQLTPFDQLHYFGTDAVDEAIEKLEINAESRILDVGAGLGGPARYIADKTGCSVTAVELQSDMNDVAKSLTERCGLDSKVEHVCADIHEAELSSEKFDAIVSWLAIYHIPEQLSLYQKLGGSLKSGGKLYFEDLFRKGEFTAKEQYEVDHLLYGANMQTEQQYVHDLQRANFSQIDFEETSEPWAKHVAERLDNWRAMQEYQTDVHGEDIVAALDNFYDVVARQFKGGKLGGVRVMATAP